MKGTILNTSTVLAGSIAGLLIGKALPIEAQDIALSGLGIVSLGLGLKMFLGARNVLIVALAIGVGGMIGLVMGFQSGLNQLADVLRHLVGGGGSFTDGFVTACVLYCVGPMTIIGCIEDGIQGKSELLRVKSTMDGLSSIFLAATLGGGVLVSAIFILVFQGLLTLFAKQLKGITQNESMLQDFGAAGGVMMVSIGFGLLQIKKLPTADYMPSLLLIPLFAWLVGKWEVRNATSA